MNDLFTKTDYSLYSNAMTFLRQPYQRDPLESDADVVVLGVPLDMATSGRPGARMGPDAIRRASVNLAWEGKKLLALFPVCYQNYSKWLRWGELWNHDECFLNSPLYRDQQSWLTLSHAVMQQRGLFCLLINSHHRSNLVDESVLHTSVNSYYRAYFDLNLHSTIQLSLSGKKHKEHRRLVRRITEKQQIPYSNISLDQETLPLLAKYMQLERQGWKGKQGTAMLCQISIKNYYQSVFERAKERACIQVQMLGHEDDLLACSFRFLSQNTAFEIKTSFNESQRSLSPGVVLECLNLKNITQQGITAADSCAQPKNTMLARTWPSMTAISNTLIYRKSWLGLLLWIGISAYKKKKYRHDDYSSYSAQLKQLFLGKGKS